MINWEKCHFVVQEGIELGHKVSNRGIEVDKAKVDILENLIPPTILKTLRGFLGHVGFDRRFIKEFSKIAKPLLGPLEKSVALNFSKECMNTFNTLKERLVYAPILIAPDWNLSFELVCDASDTVVGVELGQRKYNIFFPFYYASHTLNSAKRKYATTEKNFWLLTLLLINFVLT